MFALPVHSVGLNFSICLNISQLKPNVVWIVVITGPVRRAVVSVKADGTAPGATNRRAITGAWNTASAIMAPVFAFKDGWEGTAV